MYKTGKQSETSKQKTKFRQSAKWKKFRAFMKKSCRGTDFLTQKKLIKGFSLHHKDMRLENYQRISNPERFVCLNKQSHEFLHFAFKYYQDDPEFIDRLKILLDDMQRMNSD